MAAFLRAHRPGAVICDSDDLAYRVHLSAIEAGLDPGRQPGKGRIVITGVDDAPVRRQVDPVRRWPTLAHDYAAFVEAAIDVLIAQRNGDRDPQQRYVAPVLVGALEQGSDTRSAVYRP